MVKTRTYRFQTRAKNPNHSLAREYVGLKESFDHKGECPVLLRDEDRNPSSIRITLPGGYVMSVTQDKQDPQRFNAEVEGPARLFGLKKDITQRLEWSNYKLIK